VLPWRAGQAMATSKATVNAVERPHKLPAQLPSLIGRDEAVADVRDRLLRAERGLLTLTGTGGSGKTLLALAVASTLIDSPEFADGVFLAELAPLGDPGLVPGVLASSLGVKEQPGRLVRDTLVEELRWRSVLLVLDNCEHLVEPCATLADDLLRNCRSLRILATSREPLRIGGERVWRVPPLPAPDVSVIAGIDELAKNPAVQLFMERAQAVEPGFMLTEQSRQAIAGICARLDGLPLAIELAAARARVLGPDQILVRLDDTFRLLVGGSRTAPTRQQTLRATLDWSFCLLDPPAQQRFEQLAVFAGGFDLEAVEAIWSDAGEVGPDALEMLTGLVDRSLVTAQPLGGGMRYRLLEPVREYAQVRLQERGASETSRMQHAKYFLRLAERAEQGLQSADSEVWLARLKLEHDNIRTVLRRCLDGSEAETALRMASALRHFWRHAGYRNEGSRWLEDALALAADAPTALQAKALQTSAEMAYSIGDYGGARARFDQAAAHWRQLGDRAGLGATLTFFGRIVTRTAKRPEEYRQGKAMLVEAIALNRHAEKLWYAGLAMHLLGFSLWEHSELDLAASILGEAEAMLRQLGEPHLHGHVVFIQGGVARDVGDLARAGQLIQEGLAELRTIDCWDGIAEAMYFLAGLTRLLGGRVPATTQAVECLLLQHRLSNRADLANCVELLGGLACDMDQPEQAAPLFAAAATLREQIGVPMPLILRHGYQRDVAIAREALGARRFDRGWAQGALMSVDQLVEYASQLSSASIGPKPALSDPLSRREREVVALLARGYTNRQIAEELVISERTADGHVANILGKLGFKTRAQVAVWAVDHPFASIRA
jgi:non-specific serine/threonine protein kinase